MASGAEPLHREHSRCQLGSTFDLPAASRRLYTSCRSTPPEGAPPGAIPAPVPAADDGQHPRGGVGCSWAFLTELLEAGGHGRVLEVGDQVLAVSDPRSPKKTCLPSTSAAAAVGRTCRRGRRTGLVDGAQHRATRGGDALHHAHHNESGAAVEAGRGLVQEEHGRVADTSSTPMVRRFS